jgi:tetratricopeptide (TPR) repeat protein
MPLARALPLVCVVLTLAACSPSANDGQITGVHPDKAQALSADQARFESAEDPPINASTHYAAAQLAESQGALDQAVEQYRRALKADPRHRPSLYRLAVTCARLKSYDQAIDAWKRYAELTNDDPTALSNLGFCYELSGRPADAEATYQRAIARDPRNEPCRVNYGLMLARQHRRTEAIIHLQAVLSPAQVHYNLASIAEAQGRRPQAIADYRKALELSPDLADARSRLAALE